MWITPNNKHLDKALEMYNMLACKAVPTPMVNEIEAIDPGEDPSSDEAGSKRYRSAVMCLMYYAQDKFEAQYATRNKAGN